MDENLREQHASIDKALDKRLPLRDEMKAPKVDKLRSLIKQVGHGVVDVVPEGVEKEQALVALRQVLMWVEAGTELHQESGIPRITAARIDEATAVAMRDKGSKLPGEI